MDRFSKLHPITSISFFVLTFIFVLTLNNPFFSAVSLLCAVIYEAKLRGNQVLKSLKFTFVILIFVSLFNMLFAHYGENVLFKIKETEFTLETLFYGFNQGMVLAAVIIWFSSFSVVLDSEKIIYIFRFAPKCALIFSMVLGFFARFNKKLTDIREAQAALRGGVNDKTLKERYNTAINNFSALITYSLESSIITADSMNARGYNPRAVRYGRYRFNISDIVFLIFIILLSVFIFYNKFKGNLVFVFDPEIYSESFSVFAFVCFVILELFPVLLDLWEDFQWRLSVVKS